MKTLSVRDRSTLPSKIAEFQNSSSGIEKQILGLDITMADSERMNIRQTSEQLIHVKLDLKHGHRLLDLGVVARCAIDGLWNIFEHKVEEDFILLPGRPRQNM